ncbi:hypothetical protein Asp14428_18040 [Actinoplanes sp. NBRC 14428]|nr:hypothetical protein Asp14428_18040 [Actinoplanes sp. NBRC 14428]
MSRSTNTRFAVAVHVLTYLAGLDDRAAGSEELARSANVNPVYIRQVMGPLRGAGLVRSKPGVHGGWALALLPTTSPSTGSGPCCRATIRSSACTVPTRAAPPDGPCSAR